MPMVFLTKRYGLSILHSIPEKYVGSKCGQLHGHDFKLAVTVTRSVDAAKPEIICRSELDWWVDKTILSQYNNTNINLTLEFGTGEFLAQEFFKLLKNTPIGSVVHSVELQETRKNTFMYLRKSHG